MRYASCTVLCIPLLIPFLQEGERGLNVEPVAVGYDTNKAYLRPFMMNVYTLYQLNTAPQALRCIINERACKSPKTQL